MQNFFTEKRKPVNLDDVQRLERQLHVKFPTSYIDLLKVSNGGVPTKKFGCNDFYSEFEIDNFLGISNIEQSPFDDVFYSMEELKTFDHTTGEIIFAWITYPHDFLAFDFKDNTVEPKVVMMYENMPEPGVNYSNYPVANNFAQFIQSLKE